MAVTGGVNNQTNPKITNDISFGVVILQHDDRMIPQIQALNNRGEKWSKRELDLYSIISNLFGAMSVIKQGSAKVERENSNPESSFEFTLSREHIDTAEKVIAENPDIEVAAIIFRSHNGMSLSAYKNEALLLSEKSEQSNFVRDIHAIVDKACTDVSTGKTMSISYNRCN